MMAQLQKAMMVFAMAFLFIGATKAFAQERTQNPNRSHPTLSDGVYNKTETVQHDESAKSPADKESTQAVNKTSTKPLADPAKGDEGFAAYEEAFVTWMKNNPAYDEELTEADRRFIGASDFAGLYKHNLDLAAAQAAEGATKAEAQQRTKEEENNK